MAFLDFLTGKKDCPRCGTPGAKEIKGLVYCPNPTCSNFSESMGPNAENRATASETFSQSADSSTGSAMGWSETCRMPCAPNSRTNSSASRKASSELTS